MSSTRDFRFIVGPETSTLPDVGVPDSDDDLISRGYADGRYTQGSLAVADVTGLKAIAAVDRIDGDLVLIKSTNNLYRFDSASAVTGDDNFFITPTTGSGRWVRVTVLNRANTFTDTTQSTDKDTGGAIFEGGVGIEKNLNVGGNTVITGNLTVSGTTTTVNTDTLDVEDPNITVNKGGNQATANSAVAGITVNVVGGTDARHGYDSSLASRFKAGDSGSESEVMTVATAQTVSGIKSHTAPINLNNQNPLRFYEATAGGTNYVGLKAPAALAGDITFTLPTAFPPSNQVIQSDSSGVMTFANAAATPAAGTVYSDGTALQSIAFTANGDKLLSANTAGTGEEFRTLSVGLAGAGATFGVTFASGSIVLQLPDMAAAGVSRGLLNNTTQSIPGAKTMTGNFVVGATALFVDATNKKAAIGTSSMTTGNGTNYFEITGATNPRMIISDPGTSNPGYEIWSNGNTKGIVQWVESSTALDIYNGIVSITVPRIRMGSNGGVNLKGTTTNDAGGTAEVGEFIQSRVTTNTAMPATNTFGDVTSISLTAGDWDVDGIVWFDRNGATQTGAQLIAGISSTAGNSQTGLQNGDNKVIFDDGATTYNFHSLNINSFRVSLSATTTYYLKVFPSTYSVGNPQYQGRISARRRR